MSDPTNPKVQRNYDDNFRRKLGKEDIEIRVTMRGELPFSPSKK